ncbi:MAG: phosphotransferase [Rhodobacterales bacterium]|nr:phosphotransferase [Rhodobacterales bacterium]
MAESGGGRFGRLAKLGKLGGSLGARYLGDRVRTAMGTELEASERNEMHVENAKQIVAAMGKMKGAAMKLGQQIALASSSLDLPEEATRVLSTLHAKAEPVPFHIIKEDVEQELEGTLEDYFESFDPHPLGTASLGQAHGAVLLDGTPVVVKVLHRGVKDNLDTDMMALRAMLVSGRVLRRDKAELEASFDEIRSRLEEELDYLQEAANIQEFTRIYGDDPDVRIPAIHPAFCTERILTMDRMPGVHLDEFLKTASPQAMQRAALTLTHMYYRMVLIDRILHADPHPGNYLFEADGRVGMVDFGCIKRFDEFWVGTYARVAIATHHGDKAACIKACHDLGAIEGHKKEDEDLVWEFCRAFGAGFRMGEIELGSHHEQFMRDMKPILKRYITNPRAKMPREVLFMHRSLGGLYSITRALNAKADFGAIMLKYSHRAVAKAEGRE